MLQKCFPKKMEEEWPERLRELIPTHGVKLNEDRQAALENMAYTAKVLGLDA